MDQTIAEELGLKFQFVETNGIALHVAQAGPEQGPLVILLHGFPESWYAWRTQIRALIDQGYRVWLPDQRGYNLSDKPVGVSSYSLDVLAADVYGLIAAADVEKALVVGHDWGAAVAWWLANTYPGCLHGIVVINGPHHAVLEEAVRNNFKQALKSWYVLFFQIPLLPEFILRFGNVWLLQKALRLSSREATFSQEHLDNYVASWTAPDALSGMLNWYRAIVRKRPRSPLSFHINLPVLLIWGEKDRFFLKDLAVESIDYCEEGNLVMVENATHWVHHEEPEYISHLLLDFLEKYHPTQS